MNIGTRLAAVQAAEADCATRRTAIGTAWNGLKQEAGEAATPKRVVIAGLVAGFIAGWPRMGGKASGSLFGGKILNMAIDSAFASIGAAITAGIEAAGAEPPDADPSSSDGQA